MSGAGDSIYESSKYSFDLPPHISCCPIYQARVQERRGQLVFEGHAAHAGDEMQVIYHEVLADGERLGVKMPHLRGFQAYVERQGAPVIVS